MNAVSVSSLARRPVFWVALLAASALCMFAVLHWFGDAFSVLDLEVTMSRDAAVAAARRSVDDLHLGETRFTEAVASFDGDQAVQTFVELEGGGKPALKPLLGGDEYTLYRWRVRLFTPGVEREAQVAFTPDGRPEGFFVKVPEAAPGAALAPDDARAVALRAATDRGVDFARYRALSSSSTTQPGKRVDHEFIYEREQASGPPIGDGRLRLRLVVSGDRLTQLQRFVYVPEAFARRYETMRSANDNIAAAASIVAGLVYGLGGCLVGTIWLMRRKAVRWTPASRWAGTVAALLVGAGLVGLSGSWLNYDTATSATSHRVTGIVAVLTGGAVTWLLLTVVFGAAEGLDRMAFGSHPRLWRSWLAPSAYSGAIWGRTLAGYAWIGFDLAFIAVFYFLVQRYLGWWSPSDALIDPNILGKPLPWLAPVSMALQAGMMEESLFRAIPLAGAALLGRRFGREKAFIVVALLLQAIVFGCAHANYPGQPAYARPIELFLPSLVWGIVYLRYGLVPGMLFHFGFDLVLMSIPLFVTDVPGILVDRAMVIGILALPLIVLTVQRVRAGRFVDLPDSERNAADRGPAVAPGVVEDAVVGVVDPVLAGVATSPAQLVEPVATSRPSTTRAAGLALGALALVGVVGLGVRLARPYDAPPLALSRDEAVGVADRVIAERGVTLSDARWKRSVRAFGVRDEQARFIWLEGGEALFHRLVGDVVAPPHWEVRYARFDANVVERDVWRVVVANPDGAARTARDGVRLIEHDVPESQPGKRLDEGDARALAERAIADWTKLSVADLRPVSAKATSQPARGDWLFTYVDPSMPLPAGAEARVVVALAGDEVAGVGRALFVPDAWDREQRRRDDTLIVPRALLGIFGLAFFIALMVSLVRRLARGEIARRGAWVGAVLTALALAANALLDWNATQFGFTVAEPFAAQLLRVVLTSGGIVAAGALLGALFSGVGVRIASTAPALGGGAGRWAAPIAIALAAVGASGLGALFGTQGAPLVPGVGGANSLVPALGGGLSALEFPTTTAVALLVAMLLAPAQPRWRTALAVGAVVVAALGRASRTDPTIVSVALAAVGGALAWFVYRTWIRDRAAVVAPTLLVIALVGEIVPFVRPPYPGARIVAVAAAVATVVAYRVWLHLVASDRRSSSVPASDVQIGNTRQVVDA